MSWQARFERIAAACRGARYCKVSAQADWREARKLMPAAGAYAALVDQHFRNVYDARSLLNDNDRDRCLTIAAKRCVGVQTLPKWCMAVDSPYNAPDPADRCLRSKVESMHKATLWFGDIPSSHAQESTLNEILYKLKPRHMPSPHVRKVVRKGYRADPTPLSGESKVWLGYAFVQFRDTQEAGEALAHFDSLAVPPSNWTFCVKWAEEKHQATTTFGRKMGPSLPPGENPPLAQQLFPTSFRHKELAGAFARHWSEAWVPIDVNSEPWVYAELIKAFYRYRPRNEIWVDGANVPKNLLRPLQAELDGLRWPPIPHRHGMQTQHYMVLHMGKPNVGYERLTDLICDVLSWVDPSYGCNKIAVTKNFEGSPHIDSGDVSYQYALSLGDFRDGGELCIEGSCPRQVWVVNTKDRIAKIDGRFVHWVRGHQNGDRYSVIFFTTKSEHTTDKLAAVHAFTPAGYNDDQAAQM